MKSAIEELADEVRAQTAAIPRDVSPARFPRGKSHISEEELMRGLRPDPENELPGLLARIKLLELQMTKVMREMAQARGK